MQTNNEDAIHSILQAGSLDDLVGINQTLEGVTLQTLAPGATIYARTRHNDYRIVLLDPKSGRAVVQGGRFFIEPTEATVVGATFGGCIIKLGWICIGLRLEIDLGGQPILTSPVQALRVEHETDIPFADDAQQSQRPS